MEHYRAAERILRESLGEDNDVYLSSAARIAAVLLARRELEPAEQASAPASSKFGCDVTESATLIRSKRSRTWAGS